MKLITECHVTAARSGSGKWARAEYRFLLAVLWTGYRRSYMECEHQWQSFWLCDRLLHSHGWSHCSIVYVLPYPVRHQYSHSTKRLIGFNDGICMFQVSYERTVAKTSVIRLCTTDVDLIEGGTLGHDALRNHTCAASAWQTNKGVELAPDSMT